MRFLDTIDERQTSRGKTMLGFSYSTCVLGQVAVVVHPNAVEQGKATPSLAKAQPPHAVHVRGGEDTWQRGQRRWKASQGTPRQAKANQGKTGGFRYPPRDTLYLATGGQL